MPRKKPTQRKSKSIQQPSPQPSPLSRDELPIGLTLRHELHTPDEADGFNALAWSPDGRTLALGTAGGSVWLWDSQVGEFILDPIQLGNLQSIHAIAWSPKGEQLAFAGEPADTVVVAEIMDDGVKSCRPLHVVEPFFGIFTMAWSPDKMELAVGGASTSISIVPVIGSGDARTLTSNDFVLSIQWMRDGRLVSGSGEGTLSVWDAPSGELQQRLEGHTDLVVSLALTPDEMRVLSASSDRSIRVWDLASGTQIAILEGHRNELRCVDTSVDARLAVSQDNEGQVRLWRLDTLACIADFIGPNGRPSATQFHPTEPWLAVTGKQSNTVSIYTLDVDALLGQAPQDNTVRYANAKVVLVGDTGVGKTGLATRLVHGKFEPSESTHGRRVLTLGSTTVREDATETHREILLWDLAGQPGYRLIHQLHMHDASIALILFDARSETDPFGAASYWSRALDQAQTNTPITKFLVASRTDRGGVGVSEARIKDFCKAHGFDDRFFRTSAKTGEGCEELDETIRAAINWDRLPVVGSTQLLADVRGFIASQKQDVSVPTLLKVGELWANFRDQTARVLTEQDFARCLYRLEKTDDLDILLYKALDESATDQDDVLLEPSYVDAYASAIVIEARDEPDGIGYLQEQGVLAGRFRLNDEERLPDAASEHRLLVFVVEELLSFEIALRELIDGVNYLVFPSQYTRDAPFPGSASHGIRYDFAGPVRNIFTTLLVRLAHNREFKKRDFYRDAARYESEHGGSCVIQFADTEEGRGRMIVFFEDDPSETVQHTFLAYVYQHLKRNALPQSIVRRRTYNCPKCGYLFSDTVVEKRLEAGRADISCPQCDTTLPLLDLTLKDDPMVADEVRHIDEDAQDALARQLADSAIQGKRRIGTYDLVLIGHDHDLSPVLELAENFQAVGLQPWLEIWETGPESLEAERLEATLDRIPALVVACGPSGPPWRDRRRSKQIGDWVARGLRPCLALLPDADLPSRRSAALKSAGTIQLESFNCYCRQMGRALRCSRRICDWSGTRLHAQSACHSIVNCSAQQARDTARSREGRPKPDRGEATPRFVVGCIRDPTG